MHAQEWVAKEKNDRELELGERTTTQEVHFSATLSRAVVWFKRSTLILIFGISARSSQVRPRLLHHRLPQVRQRL